MKPHPSYQSLLPALACLHDTPAHFLQAQSNVLGVGLGFKVADSDLKHLKVFQKPIPFALSPGWFTSPSTSQGPTAGTTWSFWIL